jgi:hypothetical protein
VLRRSGSSWWVMCEFELDVFGYTPTQTTLAHPSPPRVALPFGAAAFGIATLASLRSPRRGVQRKAKAFYRTEVTPPGNRELIQWLILQRFKMIHPPEKFVEFEGTVGVKCN